MSQKEKMKKSLTKQETGIALKNQSHALWGVFHNLQQNRWHKVAKRLPRAPRIGHGKPPNGHEKAKGTPNVAEAEHDNENITDKCTAEGKVKTLHRSSMKSRIKALISEERSRRKIRHKRSTSYPSRPSPGDKILSHHKGKSLDEPVDGSNPNPLSEPSNNVKVSYLKQNEIDQLGNEPVKDHTVVHGNLVYAIEPSKDDAINESKLFMNALTLLNMREEMFMTILKDPTSNLANNQMQTRQTPNLRLGLNKSMTFCAPNPPESENVKTNRSRNERGEDQDNDENHTVSEVSEVAPPSNIVRKKSDHDRVGLMHFKNIRAKIKFVIRDRKKEKTRITMDALHHKVPFGVSPSEKISEEIQQLRSGLATNSTQSYKRTSSFDESLDRYNQLMDVSSSKEGKDHTSDESKLKVGERKPTRIGASLGRILSSPQFRSYAYNNNNEGLDKVSLRKIRNDVIKEEKPLDQLDSQDKGVTNSSSENGKQGELLDEAAHSDAEENGSKGECETSPSPQPSKPKTDDDEASISEDSRFHERPSKEESTQNDNQEIKNQDLDSDSWFISDDMIDLDVDERELALFESNVSADAVNIVQENQIHQFYNDLMQVETDPKNKAEFNYVKGVLELSGFSKNEPLGEWQSAENPLDPSMFEEVGPSSVEKHEYYSEDGISNQLLLFDLINEVLLQVHERSFCYWPTPLTCRSNLHPLPKGSRVLEEVWKEIGWLLKSRPECDDDDDAVSRDLAKNDGWMNLQLDAECVGIELEELIFDDLVQEIFGG